MEIAMKDGLQETEDLVRRGGEGDQGALEELFSRHRERLRRMVSLRLDWRLRRRVGEEDILQEVYLEAARRLGEYLRDPKLPFFLWLRFLTRQKLADTHRQHLGAEVRDVRREVRLGQGALPDATSAYGRRLRGDPGVAWPPVSSQGPSAACLRQRTTTGTLPA